MTLWGGRFSGKLDETAWALNTSLPVDQRMAIQDVDGSLAWAQALKVAGILDPHEYSQIASGLANIRDEFNQRVFTFAGSDEDIHTAVERRLMELIGSPALKLHTGRSRNDQVATDFRLWMLSVIPSIQAVIAALQSALLQNAEASSETLMPGYTHLQRAQPILLSHWWLSHFWPLQRDRERLDGLFSRVASLPLGSGALAGTSVHVDREALAAALGFTAPSPNSLDAVSDRDFAAEFLFCASLVAVHLSKLAEQVVIYTSAEFGFFELSDTFSTGSSLMPQKKNPDVFELARSKAGTLLGLLTGLMATLKGLPSTYDKDLQEDKAPVFAAADTLLLMLPVLTGAFQTIIARPERMRAAIDSFMMATDLADYLVGKGIPFRETHALAGRAVRLALDNGLGLDGLTLAQYKSLHPAFEADLYTALDPLESVKRRNSIGGTAPEAVHLQIQKAKIILKGE
ncbi:MAG TPA: argininosuccinate lyase [Anaerolineales bacterium]|jgi:argininosuccinate lyase